jgi:hypothetical protein
MNERLSFLSSDIHYLRIGSLPGSPVYDADFPAVNIFERKKHAELGHERSDAAGEANGLLNK